MYFISTHGARKGLPDTALKNGGLGFYLTRKRLMRRQDVIINEKITEPLRNFVRSIYEGTKKSSTSATESSVA